ncbi:Ankrd28, partial [Symbiodinium microadriaticum]
LNAVARSMIAGSFSCAGNAEVQCAACGDEAALREILRDLSRPHIAKAAGGGFMTVVQRLAQAGADVNIMGERGTTALMEAAWGGHLSILCFLLENGACILARNNQGRTALHWAALQGHVRCVKLLIEAMEEQSESTLQSQDAQRGRFSIDVKDSKGFTPLMFAARNGHSACVDLLISKGASVLERTTYGRAALAFAAKYGHLECVKVLLQAGSDLSCCDNLGQSLGYTAVDHARSRNHDDTVRAIELFVSNQS